jgi:hypothetical protein
MFGILRPAKPAYLDSITVFLWGRVRLSIALIAGIEQN